MPIGTTPLTGPPATLAGLLATSEAWLAWLASAAAASGQPVPDPAGRIHRTDVQSPEHPFASIDFESGRIFRRQAGGSRPPVVGSEGNLVLLFEAARTAAGPDKLAADVLDFETRVEAVLVEMFKLCQSPQFPDLQFELLEPTSTLKPADRPGIGDVLQISFRVPFKMP